jgi:sulfoxide reductase heme-binding subunit YedZ
MLTVRLQERLLRHHLPLGLASLAGAWLFYSLRPVTDVISRLSFATAYPAFILLAVTLLIGPFKLLLGERLAVSLDLRRDVGIWAGITGVLHAGIGQCVHLRGRPWLYYVYDSAAKEKHSFPLRHDLFGVANDTGLIATLILLVLLATSNDAALRKLGTPGWKRLQRWNYYCFGLTALHTFAYQEGMESQRWPFLGIAILAVALAAALQLAGWRRRRAQSFA